MSELPKVIVRAWGNEPVVLAAHGRFDDGKWVRVGKQDTKRPIGFPIVDVFEYDERYFNRLTEAFSSGDVNGLAEAYAACTTYQGA